MCFRTRKHGLCAPEEKTVRSLAKLLSGSLAHWLLILVLYLAHWLTDGHVPAQSPLCGAQIPGHVEPRADREQVPGQADGARPVVPEGPAADGAVGKNP
eukprot:4572030-Pyramimonas_sp.AAC.2